MISNMRLKTKSFQSPMQKSEFRVWTALSKDYSYNNETQNFRANSNIIKTTT